MTDRPVSSLRAATAALLGFLAALPLAAAGEAGARPSIRALAIESPIVVDGVLEESAWQRAEVGRDFTTREPVDKLPASEPTEFMVVYTPSTLYFGIRAFDSQPDAIVAKEMERDAPLGQNDDSIAIVLDTFADKRNSYSFEINPNGARTDALVTDEGQEINTDWDGVWSVATRRDERGWFAEVAIPFSTLRYQRGSTVWGLNVRRLIRHKNEESHWAALNREIGPRSMAITVYAAHWVSLAGELRGLENIRPTRRVDVKPFLVGVLTETPGATGDRREDDTEAGLDLKLGVAKSLSVDLTYNTDFAEVEVDQQQVNLTRFSLFFPEKREFFLENSGIFDFGPPNRGRDEREANLLDVFFSRRIGLEQGRQVPMEWGGRVTGRLGGWNLGLLNVLTDSVDAPGQSSPETRFSVARLKRNVGRRSSIGAIFTDRDEDGLASNKVYGLDLSWKPTQATDFFLFGAQSDDPRADGDEGSWGTGFLYLGRNVRASVDVVEAQEDFDPGIGFLQRDDFVRYNPRVRYTPRINRYGQRGLFFEAVLDYFASSSTDQLESRRLMLSPIGSRTTREFLWRLAWIDDTEQLFVPFVIRPGFVIPPGLYRFDSWELAGRTNPGKLVSARGSMGTGDFYSGERTFVNLTTLFRMSRFFRAETLWAWNDVELPQGEFSTSIYSALLNVSFTPDLRINTLMQYNDAAELVGLNVRFNWTYRPGADLYVVYNENWAAPTFSARETTRRQLIAKVTYLWQG
ncbi:MAG TPA: DUF5916 domain-containing protein [Thermoanaerobaculia bacterium]|nr:DUF5916 domain-containing protein [Thermoanaerobaculia bacterium]